MISFILLVAAVIALGMAAFNFPSTRVSLFALGVFLWALSVLVTRT